MDLTNLISIYGYPHIIPCPQCQGNGCTYCNQFGYIGQTSDSQSIYTFNYPLYVDLKKRSEINFLRYFLLLSLTIIFFCSLILAYVINITRG